MASGDKVYIADKATLDEVKGKIGSTNDAQSSSTTTGSVFAKLNYLVSQVSNYLSNIYQRLGTPTDSASSSTTANAHQKLNWFLNLFGKTDDAQSSSPTTGSIFAKLNYLVYQVSIYLSTTYSWASKIGNTNDTGGTTTAGSVTAKENAILTEVNKIGNTNDTGATSIAGTAMGKLNAILAMGCVKSVQRGYIDSGTSSISIPINTVNPAKCMVILNNTYISSEQSTTYGTALGSITSTTLTIRSNYHYFSGSFTSNYVSWQVIEFY